MISNAIGTIHPVEFIIQKAKSLGARVHLDIAQVVSHQAIDLSEMNIDFASFSGHKVFAPFGIGVFWGREDLLNQMKPYHFGGEMIKEVYMDKATYNDLPYKFEAGTPNVMGGIALAEAFDYIDKIGMSAIEAYESSLYEFAYEELSKIEALQFHSPKGKSIASLSFSIGDIHPFDIGQILDAQGIAIRTGHHCAQPIMRKLGIEGTCRASICFYNTEEEILALVRGLKQGIKMLS
jgi:cysteine desulfurase/selenocysteine lyase